MLINYECAMAYTPISCHIPRGIDHYEFYRKEYEPMFPVADRSFFGHKMYPENIIRVSRNMHHDFNIFF